METTTEEPLCTFDPKAHSTVAEETAPATDSKPNSPEEKAATGSSEKEVFRSSNPFDITYVPTGLDDDNKSPQKEDQKVQSISISETVAYTTSTSLDRRHQEFLRNAYAPIDPEFQLRLQKHLVQESRPTWPGVPEQKGYHFTNNQDNAIEEFEPEDNNQYEVQEETVDPNQTQNQILLNLLGSNGSLLGLSAENFQNSLLETVNSLQNLDDKQRNEILATMAVLQGQHPSQAPQISSNENSRKEPWKNRGYQQNHPFHRNQNGQKGFWPNKENQPNLPSTQAVFQVIDQSQLNPISALNELRTKIQKPLEYQIREQVIGKSRMFECTCLLNQQVIGQFKAGSKQNAKTGAAKEGLSTLVHSLRSMSVLERDTLIRVIERMSGKQLMAPNPPAGKAVSSATYLKAPMKQMATRSKSGRHTLSSKMEEEENFDNSQDSATLENNNTKQSESHNLSGIKITSLNVKRNFFDTCLEDEYFDDLKKDPELSSDSIQRVQREFETYLTPNIDKHQLNQFFLQTFKDMFSKISEYTSKIFAEGRQQEEGEKNLVDYVTTHHLIPIGSFALECMRTDEPVLDALFTFEEAKEVPELEVLELYQFALEGVYGTNKENGFEFTFRTKTHPDGRSFIEIEEQSKTKKFKIRIYLVNMTQAIKERPASLYLEKYDYSIYHVHRIFKCLNGTEKQYKTFKKLLMLFRSWRSHNSLQLVRPELFDVILLHSFLNDPSASLTAQVTNCFFVLTSEESLRWILGTYGKFYVDLYFELSDINKNELVSACNQTLNSIAEKRFGEAKFFESK